MRKLNCKKNLFIMLVSFLTLMATASMAAAEDNLALNMPVTQSSIDSNGIPERAVDGNTDGHYFHGSVSHTAHQYQPWWKVDLLSEKLIFEIEIWNRTECCAERLDNYTVSILNNAGTSIWQKSYTQHPSPYTVVSTGGVRGRYVKIQLNGTNPLSLAEVKVRGNGYEKNLLEARPGVSDSYGWQLTRQGGSGWLVQNADNQVIFKSSYSWCEKEQTIDLLALGFTADELDLSPPIEISEEFFCYNAKDLYHMSVELLDASSNVIAAYRTGDRYATASAENGKPQLESNLFTDYGPNVRYIRWRDGGKDTEFWSGQFGTWMQNARVVLHSAEKMAMDLIPNGTIIQLEAANGKLLKFQNGQLLANTVDHSSADSFTVNHTATGTYFSTAGGYVYTNGDNLSLTSTAAAATRYKMLLTISGMVKIVTVQDDESWKLVNQGTKVEMQAIADFSTIDEFSIHFNVTHPQSLAANSSSSTSCLIAEANFVWQISGGFLLAAGVGPYIMSGEASTGFVALVRQNAVANAAYETLKAFVQEHQTVSVMLAVSFCTTLYDQGLLWPMVKIMMKSAGWYLATKMVAKVIEVVFAPEAEIVDLAASMLIWGAQTVQAGLAISTECGN